ncbi:MAG: hypothetical protein KDD69_18260, partial [Bdellovibrionales bacterium]|nr:hypothetical protein [Bdellovibrionales bacterium]
MKAVLLCLVGICVVHCNALACETIALTVKGNLSTATEVVDPPDLSAPIELQISQASVRQPITIFDASGEAHSAVVLFFRVDFASPWIGRVVVTDSSVDEAIDSQVVVGDQLMNFTDDGARVTISPERIAPYRWLNQSFNRGVGYTFDVTYTSDTTATYVEQDGSQGGCQQSGNLDFDGDGRDDYAIFRPEVGIWAILRSSTDNAQLIFKQWGLPGDYPMPGDYSGDGKADLVVWRPSEGNWYICRSEDDFSCAAPQIIQFGLPGDFPIKADFDGDRVLDHVVWRPSTGRFYVRESSSHTIVERQWGLPGDVPLR